MHNRDAEALRGRFKHNLPRIEMVDRGGFKIAHANLPAPRIEAFRKLVVDQECLLHQKRRIGSGSQTLRKIAAADCVDLVVIEPNCVQPA